MSTVNHRNPTKRSYCRSFSLNCCKLAHGITLQDLKVEFKKQFHYIWRLILYYIFNWTISLVLLIYCGRLGKLEFGAASLAMSMINVLCTSVGIGFTTACDTFFSQLYGSSNRKHIGVILQKSLLVVNLFALIILALFPNMERLFLLLNIQPDIARMAGTYVVRFMPAIPAVFSMDVFVKYLHNTNHLLATVICVVFTNVITAIIGYLFIYQLNMGISGIVLAHVMSFYVLLALLVLYIIASKVYIETWDGWSMECLYDWGPFVSLAISGTLQICLEWWGFEIGYFLAGMLGKTELSAYSITIQIGAFSYMIPLGLSVTASIRIGHSLGAKQAKTARTALCLCILCSWIPALFIGIIWFSTKDHLGKIFIDDVEVVKMVSKVIPLCIVYNLFDSTAAVCSGGLRGSGHQKIGAIVNFISFYMICLPIGAYLMFTEELGIFGLWTGISIGLAVQGSLLLIIMTNFDWNLEVHRAQKRTGTVGLEMVEYEATDEVQQNCENTAEPQTNREDTAECELETLEALVCDEGPTSEPHLDAEDNFKVQRSRPQFRQVLCRRLSATICCITIFVVGSLVGSIFHPSYNCEQFFDNYKLANETIDDEYFYYVDYCNNTSS